MIYNPNPNPEEFAQFVGTDLWIAALIDPKYDYYKYIHILEVDNRFVVYVGIEDQLMYRELSQGNPLTSWECQAIESALSLSDKVKYKVPLSAVKLLVDDIYTTGNTMEAMIELIRPYKPRKIKVLVMAKTKFHQESKV